MIGFRNNTFANPAGLIAWISEQGHRARVRPDQTVVLSRDWENPARRLKGTAEAIARLAALANEGKRAAA